MNPNIRDTDTARDAARNKLAAEEVIEMRRVRGELSCARCKRLKLKCDKGCRKYHAEPVFAEDARRYAHMAAFQQPAVQDTNTEELKRARGELSCVDCKRLKQKCDKKLPCGACVRRGCPESCPHGSVGNREEARSTSPNPTDTEEFLQRISELNHRIHLLEDALALLQSSISSKKHPLLQDDLLSIKQGAQQLQAVDPEPMEGSLAETVEAFGTMTIGDHGESRYFGPSAGSETLLSAEEETEIPSTRDKHMPDLLNNLAAMYPVSGGTTGPETCAIAINMLLSCLPSRSRARSLCEMFLEDGSWLFRRVQREELMRDILNPIYMAKQERKDPDCLVATEISPHKLSVLYSVFALGRLVDLALLGPNEEGDRYHQCARAALALRSIFDSPMIDTVQAILFMASYCSMASQRYSRGSIWMLSSLGCKVAQSLGMHRDPAHWDMDPVTAERRRMLFWEIFTLDMHHSVALGRPPSIELSYVDCALPQEQSGSDAEVQWMYQFSKNILGPVLELTLRAKSPDYKTILELDRKVREMPLPPALNSYLRGEDNMSASIRFKGGYLAIIHSFAMSCIHKTYFSRALLDHPANPLRSPYAASFLAATRCASAIIRSSAENVEGTRYFGRWWDMWAKIFSAAMMTGLIVTRAPSSSFAPAAFSELIIAVKLFEDGAKVFSRVRIGMDVLHRLRDKAFLMLAQHRSDARPLTESLKILPKQGDDVDELAIFSGQDRGLINRIPPVTPPSASSQPSQSSADLGMAEMPGVHPSLMEYISCVPQAGTVPGFMNHEASNYFPNSHNQPLRAGVPNSSYLTPITSSQTPADLPSEEFQPQIFSGAFPFDSSSVDYLQQLYAETLATDTQGALNSVDGMDEDWVNFLKDSGI